MVDYDENKKWMRAWIALTLCAALLCGGALADVEDLDDYDGINYINTYTPKEDSGERKKPHPKTKKVASSIPSTYATITADDLNLKNYPAVKSLSSPKEKVIMAMYIVVNEEKGEWFTVDDVIHLLVNIFEVPANSDMINTVFKRNKGIFYSEQDPHNKKALRRKLLAGAKDFATSIMQDSSEK